MVVFESQFGMREPCRRASEDAVEFHPVQQHRTRDEVMCYESGGVRSARHECEKRGWSRWARCTSMAVATSGVAAWGPAPRVCAGGRAARGRKHACMRQSASLAVRLSAVGAACGRGLAWVASGTADGRSRGASRRLTQLRASVAWVVETGRPCVCAGTMAVFMLMLTFFMAIHSNVVALLLLGLPFDRQLPWHKLLAVSTCFHALIHLIAFYAGGRSDTMPDAGVPYHFSFLWDKHGYGMEVSGAMRSPLPGTPYPTSASFHPQRGTCLRPLLLMPALMFVVLCIRNELIAHTPWQPAGRPGRGRAPGVSPEHPRMHALLRFGCVCSLTARTLHSTRLSD